MRRYPSFGQLVDWTYRASLEQVELCVVERSIRQFTGEDVLSDPFLRKESDSTLALLSDEAYETGLRRISEVLQAGTAAMKPVVFRSEMSFCMITGTAPPKI